MCVPCSLILQSDSVGHLPADQRTQGMSISGLNEQAFMLAAMLCKQHILFREGRKNIIKNDKYCYQLEINKMQIHQHTQG